MFQSFLFSLCHVQDIQKVWNQWECFLVDRFRGETQLSGHRDHPTLTPLIFPFWGFLKAQVYDSNIRDLRHLKRITDCCATGHKNMSRKIHTSTVKWMIRCAECLGEHIEHIRNVKNEIVSVPDFSDILYCRLVNLSLKSVVRKLNRAAWSLCQHFLLWNFNEIDRRNALWLHAVSYLFCWLALKQ
jgi:hypothetical protein